MKTCIHCGSTESGGKWLSGPKCKRCYMREYMRDYNKTAAEGLRRIRHEARAFRAVREYVTNTRNYDMLRILDTAYDNTELTGK
jgi:hypothetical protein